MDRKEIEQQVIEIVAEQFCQEVENVKLESDVYKDFHADSLDTVELVIEVEDEFDLAIPDEDVDKMRTVGQMVDYVDSKLKEHGE